MFGDILTAILRPEVKEDDLVAKITKDNQAIEDELFIIENSFEKLPMKQILDALEQSPLPKSATFLDEEPSEQTIRTLEYFYEMCQSSQKENKRCQLLLQESSQISRIAHEYDLMGTFALFETVPLQESLQYMKALLQSLDRELLSFQNQQNINLFQVEEGETTQQWKNVVLFLQKFKEKTHLILKSMIESSYDIKSSSCQIYLPYIHTVWSESSEFAQVFIEKLGNCLQSFIYYDINNRQYTILIYLNRSEEGLLGLTQQTKVMFQNSQIGLHLQAILQSIDSLKLFLYKLEQMTCKDKQYKINGLKKKLMERFKQYFEHMIPYLKMDKRRVFMEMIAFGGQDSEMSIYELLVNLKAGRQDAEVMVGTIRQILERMQSSREAVRTVLAFIDLAKQSKQLFSTVMFVSDQMIQGLEDQEMDEEKMKIMKELLSVREEMRVKIHSGQ